MTTELVTGYAGVAHVSSDDAGRGNAGIVGSGCYILPTMNKLACTVQSANSVAVATGDAMFNGRHVTVTSTETLTIDSGSMGMKRHDIVGFRYTKDGGTGEESVALEVIKGTPAATAVDPALPSGDILNGVNDAFMALWRVPLDGLTIETPQQMADEVVSLEDATANDAVLSHISMGTNNAAMTVDTSAYWVHDNGLMRMVFTNTGNIRVDERASTSDPWSTMGYALVTNNTAFNATANYVLAAPNGSNGAVSLRHLVAADLPSTASFSALSMTGDITLKNSAVLKDVATGNVHLLTGSSGQTQQAQYSFEYDGIYIQTRTRATTSDPWGAWSAWTKIAGA